MYFYGFVIQEFGNKVLSVEHKLLAVVGLCSINFLLHRIKKLIYKYPTNWKKTTN